MRRRFLPALAVFLFVPACSQDDPASPFPGFDARLARVDGVVQRPVTGWSQGTETYAPVCRSVPSLYTIAVNGYGEMSHLGALKVEFTGCMLINMSAGTATLEPTPGTVTAANGDELFVLISDFVAHIVAGTSAGTLVVTGGTGRFHGATGEIRLDGVDVVGEPGVDWRNTLSGWISY